MENITAIIPFYEGHATIGELLRNLPDDLPIIIIDDKSTVPYKLNKPNVKVIRLENKGYFSGAVNAGIQACETDVLILNQDAILRGTQWMDMLAEKKDDYALIGDGVFGHPACQNGYIQGTFMFIRRDAINRTGLLNTAFYPLWGATAEYQLRVCRNDFKALPIKGIPGFSHQRERAYGNAIRKVLKAEPERRRLFIKTPPEISVIAACYNYGKYLPDLVTSFVGGNTSMGRFEQQTFASFELIIVDDGSDDNSVEIATSLINPWKGIRLIKRSRNGGTAAAHNTGLQAAFGRYITVIGCDDMRETGSLERLYRAVLASPHHFIYDGVLPFKNGEYRPDIPIGVSDYDCQSILYKNHIHAGILVEKKALEEVGGYPEIFKDGREDWAINVALSIKGWCGKYIPQLGYLYRREGHNRSLRNNTPNHHNVFLSKLRMLYPEYYSGAKTIMCCGNPPKNKILNKTSGLNKYKIPGLSGAEGMKLIEYIGKNWGNQTYYGGGTGNRYVFSKKINVVAVDSRDLVTGSREKPGLLEYQENDKPAFRIYKPPKIQTVMVKEVLKPAETVVEVIAAPAVVEETKPETTKPKRKAAPRKKKEKPA